MKKALALSALPLAFLFVAAVQSPTSSQLAAIQSQITRLETKVDALAANQLAANKKGPRKFYLTKTEYNGAQALTACAAGYHMASLWEIHDPSNLRYDTELGFTLADSGSGPSFAGGWIRTGWIGDVSDTPGIGNCQAWTSANSSDQGTAVGLSLRWALTSVREVSPWQTATTRCDGGVRVWCVQD